MIVVWARDSPRSAIISTRSRKLSLYRRYQRTQRTMISRSKCRPLKISSTLNMPVSFTESYAGVKYAGLLIFAPQPPALAWNVCTTTGWRSSIGTQLDPNSCWMLMRSFETLEIRTTRSNDNARVVAEYLAAHPKIARVHYLGFLKDDDPRFALLDHLQVMKLAVSLGGTETLISHPASMTHSGVARELREEIGLSDALIRISIGIENVEDLISDLAQSLEYV